LDGLYSGAAWTSARVRVSSTETPSPVRFSCSKRQSIAILRLPTPRKPPKSMTAARGWPSLSTSTSTIMPMSWPAASRTSLPSRPIASPGSSVSRFFGGGGSPFLAASGGVAGGPDGRSCGVAASPFPASLAGGTSAAADATASSSRSVTAGAPRRPRQPAAMMARPGRLGVGEGDAQLGLPVDQPPHLLLKVIAFRVIAGELALAARHHPLAQFRDLQIEGGDLVDELHPVHGSASRGFVSTARRHRRPRSPQRRNRPPQEGGGARRRDCKA